MPIVGKFVRTCAFALLAVTSMGANAFMPVSGVWTIDSEENGRPGRGFQLDVENEVAIFYYNGYTPNGHSVFYMAFGPIEDNVFTSALREYRDGTVMGGFRRDAVEVAGPGNLYINFTSGTRGTITFPGEPSKAIAKFNFGYPKNPDGLMGTYLLAYATSAGVIGDKFTLTRKLEPTQFGNGIVMNADGSFGCENITTTELSGAIVCLEVGSRPQDDDYYTFRMAGDRGTGIGTWEAASSDYPLEVWRTATASGKNTGLNEGTSESVEKLAKAETAERQQLREVRKNIVREGASEPLLSVAERTALGQWMQEAGKVIRARR